MGIIKKLNKFFAVAFMAVMLIGVMTPSTVSIDPVYQVLEAEARVGQSGNSNVDPSQQRLRDAVTRAVANNSYTSEGGVTYRGNQLVRDGLTTPLFSELSRTSQDQLISDMNQAVLDIMAEDAQNPDRPNPVLPGTRTNWMNTLLSQQGVVGSTFAFLEDGLQADFIAAQRVLGPLYPIISQILAICILAAMLIIFMNFGIDIFAMTTPMVQQKVLAGGGSNQGSAGIGQIASGAKNKGNGAGVANLVSIEATQVIKEAVESGTGNLGSMIIKYLSKRIFGLVFFIIFVVIVASGNLMTVLGTILDMVARMMGF